MAGILDKIGLGSASDESDKKESAEKTKEEKPSEQKKESKPAKKPASNKARAEAHKFLLRPILSEKATYLASRGKYVFAVTPSANKNEIRKAIEDIYNVNVTNVNMVKMPSKQRRYGRSVGSTSAWKKAVVTVKSGEKIPGIIEAVG